MHPRRIARHVWSEWIRPLALPLLFVAAAKSSLADINYVPSGSMHPTIVEGDVVWVNKLAYDLRVPFTFERLARWSDPARGDVVVCFEPGNGTRLVKRVVGLPGDTLAMRNDVVFLNGAPVTYEPAGAAAGEALDSPESHEAIFAQEHLGRHEHLVEVLPDRPARRNFGPLTIPAGQYFVMGDNRDNSADSRYFGFMPRNKIIGRVNTIVASADYHHWLKPRFNRFFSHLQ